MEQNTQTLEIVENADAKLVEFAGKTGLEQSSTAPLVAAFRPIFADARTALAESAGVAESVKDATCVSEIKKARACRLAIRKVRLAGESVRKAQKANALAYGKAVDGFYNILEADLAPVEKALQDAEDTAERAEVARKDALESGRKAALAPYVQDVSLYAVRDMTDPAFTALLSGVKLAKEQSDAAKAKAEADRIAKEKADAEERERIQQENERLRQEAIAREAAAKAERESAEKKLAEERAEAAKLAAEAKAKADAEIKAREAAAKAERDKIEARAREEKAAADAKAKEERAAREKAEAESKALRDAAEKRARDEAEAKRKALLAPDKSKIKTLADSVSEYGAMISDPSVSKAVQAAVDSFVAELRKIYASL